MDQTPTSPSTPATPPPASPEVKPEPTPDQHRHRGGFSVGRMFVGLIIILAGLAMLSNTMGWGWFASLDWWRLWPVFIILWGLSLLAGRSRAGVWISVGVGLLVIAFIVVASLNVSWFPMRTAGTETTRDVTIERKAEAKSAVYTFDLGAIDLQVDGGSKQAVTGTFRSRGATLETTEALNGDVQAVNFGMTAQRGWWFGDWGKTTLDLALNNSLPTELIVKTGAASAQLDVADIEVTKVDIDAGASTIGLTLGDKAARTTVTVDAGATTLNVWLPKTVGARVNIDAGLATKNLPDFKKIDDDTYETENYDSAEKKVDMDLDLGASTVNVNWR